MKRKMQERVLHFTFLGNLSFVIVILIFMIFPGLGVGLGGGGGLRLRLRVGVGVGMGFLPGWLGLTRGGVGRRVSAGSK